MVRAHARRHDAGMTTERTDTALPNEPLTTYRRLERRTSNRVIGGVAGGLADYLNVDPLLIRVGFAGLMLFSGAGLPLYLLGWLFIPLAGHQDGIALGWLRSLSVRPGTLIVLGILAVVLFAAMPVYRRLEDFGGFYIPGEIFWALGIAFVGLFLLLPRGQGGTGVARPPAAAPPSGAAYTGPDAAPAAATAGVAAAGAAAPGVPAAPVYWSQPPAPAAPIVAEPPRPASPLGWYALAAGFIGVGLVALVDNASTMAVEFADYFGVALLALGIGLLVGSLWGRARGLILIALAILPFALGSSFVHVPIDGGIGEPYYQPQSLGEVRPEYRLMAGSLVFDLTELQGEMGAIDLVASVGVGQIRVILPDDAIVDITSSVEAGQLFLFGSQQTGTSLVQRVIGDGTGTGATMHLRLDVGIGDVLIYRADRIEMLGTEDELLELEQSFGG